MKALNRIKNIAHEIGNPLSQVTKPTLGENIKPFDASHALGHEIISPYTRSKNAIKAGRLKEVKPKIITKRQQDIDFALTLLKKQKM